MNASDEFLLTFPRALMQGSEGGRQERVRCEAGAAKETGPHVHTSQCCHLYHGPWFPGCFVTFVQPPVAPIALTLAILLSKVVGRDACQMHIVFFEAKTDSVTAACLVPAIYLLGSLFDVSIAYQNLHQYTSNIVLTGMLTAYMDTLYRFFSSMQCHIHF